MITVTIAAPVASLTQGMKVEYHGHTGIVGSTANIGFGEIIFNLISGKGLKMLTAKATQLVKVTQEFDANADQADRLADAMRRRLNA